jgi:hypothetical protein
VYLTYGPNSQRYFLDGTQIINSTFGTTDRFKADQAGFYLFQHNLSKREYDNLDVAEVGLWNYQLTAAEIVELEK